MGKPDHTKPNPRWSDKKERRAELEALASNPHIVGSARRLVEDELAKVKD